VRRKLSRAAIETMAIIAYHQPVTRAEVEEIRGVELSRGTLDVLMEAGWIQPKGHRETPGRPALWVTTEQFLLHFGLDRLDDLPGVEDLKAAGLLDARPTVNAYGEEAGLTFSGSPEDGDEGADDAAEPNPDEDAEASPASATDKPTPTSE
jgi:segregation and condensation protein B